MLWLLIPYVLIALPVMLLTARHVWRHGTSDGILRPGSAGGAWFGGVVLGIAWPVYGAVLAIFMLYACLVEFVLLPLSQRWFGDPDGAAEQRERDLHTAAQREALRRHRPTGTCPRGTPGCIYSDCSGAPGRSCYGPDAPQHVDMGL